MPTDPRQGHPTDLRAEIARLRELLRKATPGPWSLRTTDPNECFYEVRADGEDDPLFCTATNGYDYLDSAPSDENAAIITAAINALPALLDAAEAGLRVRERLRRMHDRWCGITQTRGPIQWCDCGYMGDRIDAARLAAQGEK